MSTVETRLSYKEQFYGKNVLVVGGSRGIGKAVVESFVSLGARTFYASRNPAEETTEAIFIKTNLSDENEIIDLFNSIDRHGPLSFLINTAAINYCKTIEEITTSEWDEVINVNLRAAFIICREAALRMKESGFGRIVNVSSIAGRHRSPVSGVHYVASKAGLIGLTRQLAFELASHSINVNVICPGQTRTEMLESSMDNAQIASLERNIPLGRIAEVKDQVEPIIFLCSDAADYITGSVIDINGGQI